MKKTLKSLFAILLVSALVFNFASCSDNDDDSGSSGTSGASLPSSTGTNELAGKTFTQTRSDDESTTTVTATFSSNKITYTVSNEMKAEEGKYDAFIVKWVGVDNYSYDSDLKVIYTTFQNSQATTYERDGKVLYTRPTLCPSSFAEYKKRKLAETKAVVLDSVKSYITEDNFDDLFSEDLEHDFGVNTSAEVTDAIFQKWYKEEKAGEKVEEADKKFIEIEAYELSGTTLKISEIDAYPSGTKFGDIFNKAYCYFYYGDSDNRIRVDPDTSVNLTYNLRITEKKYKILSATDDSMVIVPVTKDSDDLYYLYDESQKQTVAITYTDGTDKTTAKITVDSTDFEFDIDYITSDVVESALQNAEEYTES